ncbi:MAG: HNH endonuclease [Mycobacteriales bacterium]
MVAYETRCAVCRIGHRELLDAAHILPDTHPRGEPVVPNGLALCKIHHAAYDRNIPTRPRRRDPSPAPRRGRRAHAPPRSAGPARPDAAQGADPSRTSARSRPAGRALRRLPLGVRRHLLSGEEHAMVRSPDDERG